MIKFINRFLPSSKVGYDVEFNYSHIDDLEPILIHDLSLIKPTKDKILQLRDKQGYINLKKEKKKLSLIIPYRHREEHLKIFLPYIKEYLSKQNIDYELIVVEQLDKKPFNKAKLMNIGALNASKDSEYFIFHDVDLLPINIDYNYTNFTRKLFNFIEENGELKEYGQTIFGGAILVPKDIFFDINGFSNNYWQWGKEDDDFLLRHLLKGHISFYETNAKLKALLHKPSLNRDNDGNYVEDKKVIKENKKLYKQNKKIFSSFKRGLRDQDLDGISSIDDYEIKSIDDIDGVKYIKVIFN